MTSKDKSQYRRKGKTRMKLSAAALSTVLLVSGTQGSCETTQPRQHHQPLSSSHHKSPRPRSTVKHWDCFFTLSASETKGVTVTATISTGRTTGEYQPGSIKFKHGVYKSDTFGCWADSTAVVHAKLTTLKPGDHALACLLHVSTIAQPTDRQVANDPEVTCQVDLRKFA